MKGIRTTRLSSRRRGFTMVELLTVIGVISLLLVGIGILFQDEGVTTVGLKNTQQNVAAYISAAKMAAANQGANTRLLIYNDFQDTSKAEKRLRYLGVVYLDDNDTPADPGDDEWLPVNNGITLPERIHFIPPNASLTDENNETVIASKVRSNSGGAITDIPEMKDLRYPDPEGTGDSDRSPREDYFYIEFTPDGQCLHANSTLMFAVGRPDPQTFDIEAPSAQAFLDGMVFDSRLHSTGVMVMRTGSVAFVEDIGGLLSSK